MLEENEIIKIIEGNNELIDLAIKNYTRIKNGQGNALAEFIATIRTPQELQEMEASNFYFNAAFIETANPNKIIQLLQNTEKNAYDTYGQELKKVVKENLEQFVPYLETLDELCSKHLVDDEIKENTIEYLIKNNIIYNESIPKFTLSNEEYVLMCIEQEPTVLNTIVQQKSLNFSFEEHPEVANRIAKKILDEKIEFEEIPYEYQVNREIFESIIQVKPDLLQDNYNRLGLKMLTEGMTKEEVVDYYKSIKFPFNAKTVDADNFCMVLECLKNDYMTLANFKKEFTVEQYKQVYEVLKENVTTEEILASKFLTQNPYFVEQLLRQKVDLEQVNLQDTKKYEQFYLELKATAIKNGIEIPEPKDYKDVIKFKGNNVYVGLNNIECVKKGLEYLKANNLEQELNVALEQGDGDEFVIADNLEFFEELQKNGVNLNFKYRTGKKVFSLEQILKEEYLMQKMADDIRNKNYSPLEQAIAVYDIAKVFKPYKHGQKDNSADSRALYEYLDNDYMVCAGYSDLIVNLGHRLNAPYCEIALMTEQTNGKIEAHSRNYVNIVDEKYGINGFYALEPTWEQNGKERGKWEQYRSKYECFLLTTEEGRNNAEIGTTIKLYGKGIEGYDSVLTMKTPAEIQTYFKDEYYRKKWFERISILDPEFYKKMIELDFSKTEDANLLINYFDSKVNNEVPKEKLLDAIMEVKKSRYVDFSEQDFEDMRMGYSITRPFGEMNMMGKNESLYGKEYYEYLKRRYEDIKDKNLAEAKIENPCLIVDDVYKEKLEEVLTSGITLGELAYTRDGIIVTDKELIELVMQNKEAIEQAGFSCKEDEFEIEGEEKEVYLFPITQAEELKLLTLQERIESIEIRLEKVCGILGVSKENQQQEMETPKIIQKITTKEQIELGLSEINAVTSQMRRDLTPTKQQQLETD